MSNTYNDDELWEQVRAQRTRDARGNFSQMSDDDFKQFYVSMDAVEAIALAKSPYAPADAYKHLLEYPDERVHEVLATVRGNIARFLSQQLMNSRSLSVQLAVAGNPDADKTVLSALTRSKHDAIAREAAFNGSCPTDAVDDYFYEKNRNK